MYKKKISIILICALCLTFGACLIPEIPLTDQEMDIVAQYCVDTLLEHNTNEEQLLLQPTVLTPTPTYTPTPTFTPTPTNTPRPTSTPKPTQGPIPTATPSPFPENNESTWKALAKVLNAEDLTVIYAGTSEPEVSFSIGAGSYALSKVEGYEYVAVKIMIKNDSSEDKYIKTSDLGIEALLMVNDDIFSKAELTLFMNDLHYLGIENELGEIIKSGERYNGNNGAVLVFKIPAGTEIKKAGVLIANRKNDSVTIKIQ